MMNYIVDNWYLLVAAAAVVGMSAFVVVDFTQQPRSYQVEAVKQWLVGACFDAEIALGGGTGELKLRMVYDTFVSRFPWVAKVVSFDTFHEWVKEALKRLPEMLALVEAKQPEAEGESSETRAIGFYVEPANE